MTDGHCERGGAALAEAVRELYRQGETDYALPPLVLADQQEQPIGRVEDGDAVIFCCRRGEREVQLTEAFVEPETAGIPRHFQNLTFVILTRYHEKFTYLPVAFAPTMLQDTLGEVVSRAHLRQLRIAESEKYAHVTFFFNGGNHTPFVGEDDLRIPSLREIAFDQAPEMSLAQVAEQVVRGIQQQYDLIVANFANGDTLGHTQSREAKIRGAEAVDTRLGQVVQAGLAAGYVILVTADHGNLEEMTRPDGSPHTAHTTNPVPFILIDPLAQAGIGVRQGTLADVAPTILQALGLPQPEAMQGASLASQPQWGGQRRLLLIILDGWGIGKEDQTNPIFLAHTPVWDELIHRYPYCQLRASGEAVGLEVGKAGNSEAGHMNLGAGRCVLQDDVRLDLALQDGSFYTNATLCRAVQGVRQRAANLHLIGLLSEKSSHGSIDYPLALLKMAQAHGVSKVYLHVIFDGRSTQPGSAPAMLEKLEAQLDNLGVGLIATGVGRGIALDRDGNYAKTRCAYEALVFGSGRKYYLHQ